MLKQKKNIPTGFHPVRLDRLLQEQVHDTYKTRGKLQEPTVCQHCNAVFQGGRWQWGEAPAGAQRETCPACHRQQDRFPAGFITLGGTFFLAHYDEIMHLVHNQEQREQSAHPLKRIIEVEKQGESVLVTTTDIHLARSIGEAVHHAYQGELEFHYNPEENLLRVHWSRS